MLDLYIKGNTCYVSEHLVCMDNINILAGILNRGSEYNNTHFTLNICVKASLKFHFLNFSATYESRLKILHIFQQPY